MADQIIDSKDHEAIMFKQSVSDIESGMYLGIIEVVDKLVVEFINTIVTDPHINVVFETVNRYAEIFLGMVEAYKVVTDWNDRAHLGLDLAQRLSVALGIFARYALTIVKESQGKDDKEIYEETMKLKRYMVSVLLGTSGTRYQNDKGWRQ